MTEATQEQNQPEFGMEKIYVKDISLEVPNAPQIFLERDTPKIEVQLHTQADSFEKGMFEVIVAATVTAKIGERVMFLIEVKQAGVFRANNIPSNELEQVLAVMCPNILFPYLREAVSDISVRSGFAPVLLNPVNFEAIYLQQHQSKSAESATTH